MKEFLKQNKFLFLVLFFTVFITAGMIVLNDVVISIRILELKAYLRDINREASKIDHLGMVTKYRLHKQLYRETINQAQFDNEEIKTAGLVSSYKKDTELQLSQYGLLSKPVVAIMNWLRYLLDKPPLQETFNDPLGDELTIAYYYERNKFYELALDKYASISDSGLVSPENIPNILLHQGFCLAILSRYGEARAKYLEIINNYGDTDIALVAWDLLEILRELETEIEKVKESDIDVLEKSRKLYQLTAYEAAKEILKENSVNAEDKETATQARYLEARLREETGEKEESIQIYQDIIQEDHNSEEARLANRRLFVISSLDSAGSNTAEIKELSRKNNALIGDTTFNELAENAEKLEILVPAEKLNADKSVRRESPHRDSPSPSPDMDEFLRRSLETIDKIIGSQTGGPPSPTPGETVTPPLKQKQPTPGATAPVFIPSPRGPYNVSYHNSQGRLYKVENYDKEGNLYRIDTYTYDSGGKVVSASSFNPDGSPLKD